MQLPFLQKENFRKHELSELDLITKNSNPVLLEALKVARLNLMYALSDIEGGKCVLVTSALAAEGKTTTCINMAVSLTQTGAKVLMIDADMRRPRIHTYLGIKNEEGLANYLGGFSELKDVITHMEHLNLDVVTAGSLPPNPTELLASKKMQNFIAMAKEKYDYVLFDTPPVNIVADTLTLTRLAENILFVIKCGASITSEIDKAMATLKFANAKILGFLSIDGKERKTKEAYYSYYNKEEE